MRKTLIFIPFFLIVLLGASCSKQTASLPSQNIKLEPNNQSNSIKIPVVDSTNPSQQQLNKISEESANKSANNNELKSEQTITKKVVPKNNYNNITKSNAIVCNGIDYSPCSTGQRFYCPASGEAQCLIDNNSTSLISNSSPKEQCLAQGLEILNADQNKYPTMKDLYNQQGALEKAQANIVSDKSFVISAEEWASLTPAQKDSINNNNKNSLQNIMQGTSLIQKELDSVSSQINARRDLSSMYSDNLYTIRLLCGTVSKEDEMIYELRKIRELLNK